ncbi:MAG: endonuclease III [Flavobacteriales bacterium]
MRTKKEKAAFVAETLAALYPTTSVPLDHEDPYTLLVAVLLSAQCTDKKVNEITPLLFAKARTPQQMVKLSVEQIQDIIRPCGLSPMKSKGIHGLSRIILDEHGGQVPADMAALERMPGVGHKTASVVMAQAFGVPAFPVDTHIHRLAWRWTLSTGQSVERTEADLKKLFPKDSWNDLHIRIIYFGREHCPAKGHDPHKCPICSVIGRRELFR